MKKIEVTACEFSMEDVPAIAVCGKCGRGFSKEFGTILELKLHQHGDVPRESKFFSRCIHCVPTVAEEEALVEQMDIELGNLITERVKNKK